MLWEKNNSNVRFIEIKCVYRGDENVPTPANTKRSDDYDTMLAQRLRRWTNSVPTSAERFALAGTAPPTALNHGHQRGRYGDTLHERSQVFVVSFLSSRISAYSSQSPTLHNVRPGAPVNRCKCQLEHVWTNAVPTSTMSHTFWCNR